MIGICGIPTTANTAAPVATNTVATVRGQSPSCDVSSNATARRDALVLPAVLASLRLATPSSARTAHWTCALGR